MRALESPSEKVWMHEALDVDKTSFYRCTVVRLKYCAVDRTNMQYAVRVCSRSMSRPRVNDWQKRKRVARYVKGCLDTEIVFARQTAPSRFTVPNDSGWAGDRSTRKSVSAGNITFFMVSMCFAVGARTTPLSR